MPDYYAIFISRDEKVRGAKLFLFQPKTMKTCIINRLIQYSIPSEVSDNFEEDNHFEYENELAKEDQGCLRRVASENANLISHLQNY